jgi:D-alanyl-D-alanine carboxypeptidase
MIPDGTFRWATTTFRSDTMASMSVLTRASRALGAHPPTRPATARLGALLLVVALSTGVAATVVSAGSVPTCRIADTTTLQRSYTDWNKTVLDTTYRLTASYAPGDLRSTSTAGLNGGNSVRAFVIADLRAMANAARAAGARLAVQSAYRSYSTQRSTFAYWSRVSGYSAALKSSARAGHSEHQLGTTVDFRSYGGSAAWYYADWGNSKAGAWLMKNAWKYGFVMSYPKGKSSVTCYAYEPWHYRYVGRPMAATIRASGLTLREFLWRQQTAPTPTPTPTASPAPTDEPSDPPSPGPTDDPTAGPTSTPTVEPTAEPTATPTAEPTPTEATPAG